MSPKNPNLSLSSGLSARGAPDSLLCRGTRFPREIFVLYRFFCPRCSARSSPWALFRRTRPTSMEPGRPFYRRSSKVYRCMDQNAQRDTWVELITLWASYKRIDRVWTYLGFLSATRNARRSWWTDFRAEFLFFWPFMKSFCRVCHFFCSIRPEITTVSW